jgi:hypothetical protein
MGMEAESKEVREVKVTLVYNLDEDAVYIDSGFFALGFKDPIGYTAKLMEMALEKWIIEKIGISCPECDIQIDPEWNFCPQCGWSWKEEKEDKKK